MSLPNPLPDNPLRWDGWKLYNSPNIYERLGLSLDSNASNDQIEDHCRQLLVWWQKKLPLKNQPSNPLAQMLRAGLDEAPVFLAEARTTLLDPAARAKLDSELRQQVVKDAVGEFHKLIVFSLVDKQLTPTAEARLLEAGIASGLSPAEAQGAIDTHLIQLGGVRASPPPPPAVRETPAQVTAGPGDPFSEFRRMLRLSKLCLDGDDMTDDQRDALCNMGESLGLTGGEAEDVIDEYLEEAANQPMRPAAATMTRAPAHSASATTVARAPAVPARATPAPSPRPAPAPGESAARAPAILTSPAARAQEKELFPNFRSGVGSEMYLVTSGAFRMGAAGGNAQPHESPITPVTLSRFYIGRFPITNAEYEHFDPDHLAKRATWADGSHPVVYVSARDAERFCEWLSRIDGRRYRLPFEAEWEYAARGLDGRAFPWGGELNAGHYANFADASTTFAWREATINDGFAGTAPVGSFPRGASPFGIEDLAGNVCEWCADGFDAYKGKEVTNPRGPRNGARRIYRGGSWKSRATSLRAAARAFNAPDYSSNDVGFRIVCECP